MLLQDVSPRVSVILQGSITEDGLCIEYEARDAEAVERANWPRWPVQAVSHPMFCK